MEKFIEILPYLIGAIGAAIGLAAAVAKFTKTKRDDEIVAKIDDAFDKVVALATPGDKEE